MRFALVLTPTFVTTGGYHVTVDAGRTPNGATIDQLFALGYGVVPPSRRWPSAPTASPRSGRRCRSPAGS